MNNENKANINWLACIYGDHHLNSYKMGTFKNEILQVLIKKAEIIKKID